MERRLSQPALAVAPCLLGLLACCALAPSSARTETYVAGQLGVTIPGQLTNVEGIQSFSGRTFEDLALADSAFYGAKLGAFLPGRLTWLGGETEMFYTNPHVKQQRLAGNFPGSPLENVAGSRMRVTTWAFNVIARYPGERFQPYLGLGLGLFWARVSGPITGTGSDASPGMNLLAGARFFLTTRLALFGEYKYNKATFEFGQTAQLKADYTADHFVGGLSFHF